LLLSTDPVLRAFREAKTDSPEADGFGNPQILLQNETIRI